MAGGEAVSAEELAARTGTDPRYIREWLSNQAAGGFVSYDPDTGDFFLSPEQSVMLAQEGNPSFVAGAFQVITAAIKDEEKVARAFQTGGGVGWHEHHHDLFSGTERFFRPGYAANLVSDGSRLSTGWRPSSAGARVADVGCGHGASTILMAGAFPRSSSSASTTTRPRSSTPVRPPRRPGSAIAYGSRWPRPRNTRAAGYDLVCMFDCLHDMGDPVGASAHVLRTLAPDGTWLIVEPFAGDRLEDNLNPVGRIYYGASTLVCTPASRDQEVGLALGAQAGETRLREVVTAGGFTRFRRATETPFNLVLEARP